METRKITVSEVVSASTVRADDGQTYVLRGVPDMGEDLPVYAAIVAHVESRLLNTALHIDEESTGELPDLPGMLVDFYYTDGTKVMPRLAAEVAGLLAGYPLK